MTARSTLGSCRRASSFATPTPAQRTDLPERADATLDRAVSELTLAIEGAPRARPTGYPPSQLDAGLQAALRELAVGAPLPVQVISTDERFSTGLEAGGLLRRMRGADQRAQARARERCRPERAAAQRQPSWSASPTMASAAARAAPGGSGLRGLHEPSRGSGRSAVDPESTQRGNRADRGACRCGS